MSDGQVRSGCNCPGCSARTARRRSRQQNPPWDDQLRESQWEAIAAGKAAGGGTSWSADYHGDCKDPRSIAVSSAGPVYRLLKYSVRCRSCGPCRRAERSYWALAATEQTRLCQERGSRTWFGTLTADPDHQAAMLQAALRRIGPDVGWDNADCETRFTALRAEFLRETQKYWKRLRKEGHCFRYFFVVERHRSGLPHGHFLLHEEKEPIRKTAIQAAWNWGFSNVSIVGGKAKQSAAPERAAWYVAKYLSKSSQARVIASQGYRPAKRVRRTAERSEFPEFLPPEGSNEVKRSVSKANVSKERKALTHIGNQTFETKGGAVAPCNDVTHDK